MITKSSKLLKLALIGIIGFNISSCYSVARSSSEAIFANNFEKNNLKISRVAIIPNRLPFTIQEADKWKKYNWYLIAKQFAVKGFEVVNYETTNQAYQNANLPFEDTSASEEKYAQAASKIDADLLIIPYYNVSYNSSSSFVGNDVKYDSIVSLQIYSAKENKFIYRSDNSARSSYTQYSSLILALQSVITSGSTLASSAASSSDSGVSPIVTGLLLVLSVVGLIVTINDFSNGTTSEQTWWERAFDKAVEASLEPFFVTYPKGN